MDYPRLATEQNVDLSSQCLYRYVHGANDIYYPHTHDFFEIFLTLKGVVIHEVNGQTQQLPEGALVFIRPDDLHGYRYDDPKSAQTAYINVTFTRQTAAALFSYLTDSFPVNSLLNSKMPPTVYLSSAQKDALLQQLQQLNTTRWQDKNELMLRMRVILADIFVRHFSSMPRQETLSEPLWLSQLLTQMEQPVNFCAGMQRMQALSGRSREHIARSSQKHRHMSATEFLNTLRINYACNLLINTNLPVIEICYQCGFQTMSYFYRSFKRRSALSPMAFRKKHQKAV